MKFIRLKLWVIITIFIFLLIGTAYYSYKVIVWYLHIHENNTIQQKIEESIQIIEQDTEEEQYNIDFKTLKEMNPDTIAYIKVNNTSISNIVVKGENNSYYLNHNFEKKWNVAGWTFGDYRNHFDGEDKNIIIYGHNTKDGSMFNTLINVLDKTWYENPDNHTVILVTEKGLYHYQVFSSYSIIPEDYYITTNFPNNNEFSQFLRTLKSRSIYDYGVEVTDEDKILTLSSCIGDGQKRVVLHAKLIENETDSKINENEVIIQ